MREGISEVQLDQFLNRRLIHPRPERWQLSGQRNDDGARSERGQGLADFTRSELVRRIATGGTLRLVGADLSHLDLSGLALSGADLSYANLTHADLEGATLTGASLWSARAQRARMRGANLSSAQLGLADLKDADLRDAVLVECDLTGARLDGADLSRSRLDGTWLDTMQRALAIGAPPTRFPQPQRAETHVLSMEYPRDLVEMRRSDRLQLRYSRALPPEVQLNTLWGDEMVLRQVLDTVAETQKQLLFVAVGRGRVRVRAIFPDGGDPPVAFDVEVC